METFTNKWQGKNTNTAPWKQPSLWSKTMSSVRSRPGLDRLTRSLESISPILRPPAAVFSGDRHPKSSTSTPLLCGSRSTAPCRRIGCSTCSHDQEAVNHSSVGTETPTFPLAPPVKRKDGSLFPVAFHHSKTIQSYTKITFGRAAHLQMANKDKDEVGGPCFSTSNKEG